MRILTNPNFLYIFAFTVPIAVYSLGWSTIYPAFTSDLFLFFAITFIVCLLFGVFIDRIRTVDYNKIPVSKYNRWGIIALYLFYPLDILYSGFIPLFAFSSGEADYKGSINYGIPEFHILAVTFNLFFSLYVFHQYLSGRKRAELVIYLLSIVPFIILLQRSNIMYILIGSMFILLFSQKTISFKIIAGFAVGALLVFYVFGYLGNLRSSGGDSTFIPKASGVTDSFLNGPVPNEYYWSYLYIGSPLANLQNNINSNPKVKANFTSFMVNECLPDFLSKQLQSKLNLEYRAFDQINPFLNVGTIFARPFSYLSWPGMYIIFLLLMLVTNTYFIIVTNSYTYRVTGIAMMFIVIIFSSFENTLYFSAYSFQLIYPVVFSMLKHYRVSRRRGQPQFTGGVPALTAN